MFKPVSDFISTQTDITNMAFLKKGLVYRVLHTSKPYLYFSRSLNIEQENREKEKEKEKGYPGTGTTDVQESSKSGLQMMHLCFLLFALELSCQVASVHYG